MCGSTRLAPAGTGRETWRSPETKAPGESARLDTDESAFSAAHDHTKGSNPKTNELANEIGRNLRNLRSFIATDSDFDSIAGDAEFVALTRQAPS